MKMGCKDSPKFFRLMSLLKCDDIEATGLLENLWHFTAKQAMDGAVGKWTDDEICAGCKWRSYPHRCDAATLIRSLVTSGWLDVCCSSHRLVVHDWKEHCPRFVHGALARAKRPFAEDCVHRTRTTTDVQSYGQERPTGRSTEATIDQSVERSEERPILALPSQAKPNPPPPTPSRPASPTAKPEAKEVEVEVEGGGEDAAEDGEAITWTMIQARLRTCGCQDTNGTIGKAKLAGATPAKAAAVIDAWAENPGAWTVGILAWRIAKGCEGEPRDGWPPPNPESAKAKAKAAKDLQAKQSAEDAAFWSLVRQGRERGVADEGIIAVALKKGLRDAAIRKGWEAGVKAFEAQASPQTEGPWNLPKPPPPPTQAVQVPSTD